MPKSVTKSDLSKPSTSKSFSFTFGSRSGGLSNPNRRVSRTSKPSPVQKLFKKNGGGLFGGTGATCDVCNQEFALKSGNTSTLRRHAEANHEKEWNDILESEKVANQQPKITIMPKDCFEICTDYSLHINFDDKHSIFLLIIFVKIKGFKVVKVVFYQALYVELKFSMTFCKNNENFEKKFTSLALKKG